MLFQGSPRFRKGEIDRAVVEVGGTLNAFTDVDFTAYLTTVPRQHLEVPLAIEADRMTRATFEPREVERERAVIVSEREGNENWPEFRADEELYALAFRRHPYRWDPLGFPEDIVALTRDDLYGYYRAFYGPRNATLVVSGAFEAEPLRERIERDFAPLPAAGTEPTVATTEPPSTGERRATLRGPGTTPFVHMGYRAPALDDPRTPATILLDVLLGGETRLFSATSWGRSGEHPSARLYRRLVETGLAIRATSEWRPRQHPGLFVLHAQCAPSVSLDRIEHAIDGELARLARSGPTRAEMREAREKVATGAAFAYEGSTRIAFRLGYFATLGAPRLERTLLRRVLATRAEEVRRQAERMFRPESRVAVRYEPTADS
jgi:zinc protease